MMVAILFLALWAAGLRPRTLVFLTPTFLAYVFAVFLGERHASVLALGVRAVFFSFATVLFVSHALRAQKLTGDTIAAAACAYVLTAVTWANFYEILELLRPGSFDIPRAGCFSPPATPPMLFSILASLPLRPWATATSIP